MVLTIVLAAGRGSRLGGPKALLLWRRADGSELPLATLHVERRLAAESEAVLVVLRPFMVPVLRPLMPERAILLASTEADELGPAGSLRRAAAALADEGWLLARGRVEPTEDRVALITPVDCLPASATVANQLVQALRDRPQAWAARPRHRGRGGHPVAVRPEVLRPYRAGEAPPLRDRLRELGTRVCDVPVEDPAVLADLDTPEAVAALGYAPHRFLDASGDP